MRKLVQNLQWVYKVRNDGLESRRIETVPKYLQNIEYTEFCQHRVQSSLNPLRTCFWATICICWWTLASSSLPSPLVCSISSSFLMLSSLALSVCFWVSILISSSWLQSDFTHTNNDASNEYSRTIRRGNFFFVYFFYFWLSPFIN